MKKYSFKVWNLTEEPTECFECLKPTNYFITNLKTSEESFCCLNCAVKVYKLNKIVERLNKHSQKEKSSKKEQNLHIKKQEKSISMVGGFQ